VFFLRCRFFVAIAGCERVTDFQIVDLRKRRNSRLKYIYTQITEAESAGTSVAVSVKASDINLNCVVLIGDVILYSSHNCVGPCLPNPNTGIRVLLFPVKITLEVGLKLNWGSTIDQEPVLPKIIRGDRYLGRDLDVIGASFAYNPRALDLRSKDGGGCLTSRGAALGLHSEILSQDKKMGLSESPIWQAGNGSGRLWRTASMQFCVSRRLS